MLSVIDVQSVGEIILGTGEGLPDEMMENTLNFSSVLRCHDPCPTWNEVPVVPIRHPPASLLAQERYSTDIPCITPWKVTAWLGFDTEVVGSR